jgi:hypothetical protein
MSRTKKVPFFDALAIWLETADEQEIRDGAVSMSIYARQRRFSFNIRIEPVMIMNDKRVEAKDAPLFKETTK